MLTKREEKEVPQRYGTQKDVREIVLTFDDGPNPTTTPKLLDILAKQRGVRSSSALTARVTRSETTPTLTWI